MRRPRKSRCAACAVAVLIAGARVLCGGEAEPPAPAAPGQEVRAGLESLFGDITRNMDLIEQMLNRKDSGADCQGSQQQLVGKIDKLIEELKKRQSSSGGGSSGSDQSKGGKDSRNQEAEKKQRELEKMQGRAPKDKSAQQQGGKKPEPGKEEKGTLDKDGKEEQGKAPNDGVDAKKPLPPGEGGPLNERSGTGGWGFLPGEVRALIEASGRPGVPAKYEGIIKRYFQRLSEGDKTK